MNRHSLFLAQLLVVAALAGCGGNTAVTQDSGPDGGFGEAGAGTGGGGGTVGADASVGGSGGGVAGSAGQGGADGSTCPFATGTAACDDCMNSACVVDCNACAAGTQCSAFVKCALACAPGDGACMQACSTKHQAGVVAGLALVGPDGCLRASCNSPCIVRDVQCDLSVGEPACDACVAGYCMAECTACADKAACAALVACVLACRPGDTGCVLACGRGDPGGIIEAQSFVGDNGCVPEHCSVACKGAPAQCPLAVGAPDCDSCIAEQCLPSCNKCAGNQACAALVKCARACDRDDNTCLAGCATNNPGGLADAAAFMGDRGCAAQKCPSACGFSSTPCEIDTGNAGCDACIRTECAGLCSTCSEEPECLALVACRMACPANDIPCQAKCAGDHPKGIGAASALIGPNGCVGSECSFWCP